MKFKNIVISLSAVALVLLFVLWIMGRVRIPFSRISAFEAVPAFTPLLLDFRDLEKMRQQWEKTSYQEYFSNDPLIEKIRQDFDQFNRLLPTLRIDDSSKGHLLAALHIGSSRQINFLYLLDRPQEEFDPQQIQEVLAQKGQISQSTFQGTTIYHWHAGGSTRDQDFSFTHYHNLFLLASQSLLIEDAINQLQHPATNLLQQSGFKSLYPMVPEQPLQVYLALQNLPASLSPFFNTDHKQTLHRLEDAFSWAGLGLDFKEEELAWSGFLDLPEQHRLLNNLATKNKNTINEMASLLPDNTAVCSWLNIKDWASFFQQTDAGNDEFQDYFLPWIGNDFAYVITEPFSSDLESETFVVFEVADEEQARHSLAQFAEQSGELKSFDYHAFHLRQILSGHFLEPIFGKGVNSIHNPYFCQIGNYMILGNSRQSLEVWIDKYIVGQTLSADLRFLQWLENPESKANGILYLDPTYSSRLLFSMLNKEVATALQDYVQPFLQFQQFAVSLNPTAGDQKVAISGRFKVGEKKESQTSIVWKTYLKDTLRSAPQTFYNPQRRAHEIMVKDESDNIYLLDQRGDILWQRKIEEKIISDFFAIDHFKNGQQQYLFNTPDYLYLIDENGKDIGNYPLPLKSRATNPVAVVDFQNRKDYAYFVACENGNIYGFSQLGIPLPGWNPRSGVGQLKMPLQHFVYNHQDFILALNTGGKLSAFKRDGHLRFGPVAINAELTTPLGVDLSRDKLRLAGADKRGKLYLLNERGELFYLNLLVGKNEQVDFAFAQVTGDERKDYIGLSDKELAVFSYSNDNQFELTASHTFPAAQDTIFAVPVPGKNQSWIGSLARDVQEICLLDGSGNAYPGFPLAGTTAFSVNSLFGNTQNILVVGNAESVYAYKLGAF